MADQTVAFNEDSKQERIPVAIGCGRDYAEAVAGSLTLHPELLACSGKEGYVARFGCFRPGFSIHKSHHKHIAGGVFLNDRWSQPLHFFEIDFHLPASMKAQTKNPPSFLPAGFNPVIALNFQL
jgi:hypothetical protein